MIDKTWDDFFSRLDEMSFAPFDLIVAIARGGVIPAAFIKQKLNLPLEVIRIAYRDDAHTPKFAEAKLLEEQEFGYRDKNILLVDDVSRSGTTLQKAKEYLKGNTIKTCLVNGKGDYWFFQSDSCLNMPWTR